MSIAFRRLAVFSVCCVAVVISGQAAMPSGYRFFVKPAGKGIEKLVRATLVEDGVEMDLREAFAAGATRVFVATPNWDIKKFEGRDTGLVVELTGLATNAFAKFSIVPEGQDLEGHHWWIPPSCNEVVSPGRHRYVGSVLVPPGRVKQFHTRLDFESAGDGPFRLHATAFADFYPAVSDEEPPAGTPRVVFHAPLDGTPVARVAGGRAEPLATNGLVFVKGRRGLALKCDDALKTRLVYDAKGNVNPLRGSFSCWMKRDWAETQRPGFRDGPHYHAHFRNLFNVGTGNDQKPGDGQLRVWWRTSILNWERGTYGKDGHSWGPTHVPYRPDEWVHVVFTWDERHTRLYFNGDSIPAGHLSDSAKPVDAALSKPPRYRFAEGWEKAISQMEIGCGSRKRDCPWNGLIDEVRIWSEALTFAQVRKLYAAESGKKEPKGLWFEPWRDPKTPPPANAALRAPTGEPGVPAGMELVHDILPAEVARRGDKNVFLSSAPWRIGKFDGQEYLEAGTNCFDRWAIRLKLDPKVPLWCFEVTYPDDRSRANDLLVQNTSYAANDYCLNAGVETGLEHPLTMKNATKRFLFWSRTVPFGDPGDYTFAAMTQTAGDPAAISRIRIYAVKDGRLPDAGVVEPAPVRGERRHFAMWFEDPAVIYDFGVMTRTNANQKLMIDRIAAYMKYVGQDLFIYPGVWYAGLIGSKYQPRPHMSHYWREVARRFDRDGLGFVPSINQQWFPELKIPVTRTTMTDGSLHATPLSIHSTGCPNWGGWHHTPTYYNISHLDVQKALLDEVAALCEECRAHPSFRGVAMDNFNSICVTWWGNLEAGYNDYSIEAFKKATGVKVPRDSGPLRGRTYAAWLKANAYEKWVQWRCDVVTDLYRRAAEIVRTTRPDLKLYVRISAAWLSGIVRREDLNREDVTDRIYREAGIDCTALGKIPNVVLAAMSMPAFWRDELGRFQQPRERLARVRDLPESEGYLEPVRRSFFPMADFHDSYYETAIGAPKGPGHHSGDGAFVGTWLSELSWRVTAFSASGREALRPYAKALRHGDVLGFGRGGFQLGTCGDEEVTAPFMRAFRSLPATMFADVDGFRHADVRFRCATEGGRRWWYAVNTGFEPVEVALPLPADARDAVTGSTVRGTVRLEGYELRAFKATSGK